MATGRSRMAVRGLEGGGLLQGIDARRLDYLLRPLDALQPITGFTFESKITWREILQEPT